MGRLKSKALTQGVGIAALLRDRRELHFETWKRIVADRASKPHPMVLVWQLNETAQYLEI